MVSLGRISVADSDETKELALGDIDGDNDLDLVVGNYSNERDRLYLNNGTSDPFGGVVGQDISSDEFYTHGVEFGDIDEDGDLDLILVFHFDQPNRIYLNQTLHRNAAFDTKHTLDASFIYADFVHIADLDRDGDDDVIASSGDVASGEVAWWENMSGNGTVWTKHFVYGGLFPIDICTDDVDGDGDLDILLLHHTRFAALYSLDRKR